VATTSTTDISGRITEWRLAPSDIQSDLDSSTTIVRTRQLPAGAPTGAMDDSVIITMVKNKLQADSDLSALNLDVQAHNGEVTLKGSAQSAAQVGRAIALALDTDGVTKVSSDIKVSAQTK
jgi:osmotically-inducible protein OsmY